MRRSLLSTVAFLLGSGALLPASDGWLTDMSAAKAEAARDGKHILMDFTGSDWCHWCVKLKEEVFSTDEFKTEAPKGFVLVELDFPQRTSISDEQRAHNEEWSERFGVQGYPTIILTDASGELYARTGYREGGPQPYLEHLTALRKGKADLDAMLVRAKAAQGLDRARLLSEALDAAKDGVELADRAALMDEIIALDADNGAGLKARYERLRKDIELDAVRNKAIALHMSGEGEQALELLERALKEETASAEKRQELAWIVFQMHIEDGNGDQARRALEQTIKLAPDSDMGKEIAAHKDRILADIERRFGGEDGEDGGGGR